jgi:uncharacterized UPF0160 family protein
MKKTLVTHDGSFHADDVFACATLFLVFKDEEVEVKRTREEEWFIKADVVFDVGKIYNEEKDRFDHHQKDGGGKRDNAIPYAAFGLVWKKYGESICGSKEVADFVDQKLVTPVDAGDNGINIETAIYSDVAKYDISKCIASFNVTKFDGKKTKDEAFLEAVSFAKKIIEREIQSARERTLVCQVLKDTYECAEDKRVLVLSEKYFFEDDAPSLCPETIYIVYPYTENFWSAKAVRKNKGSFESRKPFPLAWVGKSEAEMPLITGVPDAKFCHNARFLVSAVSKEGAILLAYKSLEL